LWSFEPNEFAFLDKVLQPGMTFVDVGANDGYYTLFAARRVGAAGRVVAVEPSSRERVNLKRNIARNRLGNVTVVPAALAAACGVADLRLAQGVHAGHNTLGKFAHDGVQADRLQRVDVATLDKVAADLGLESVDFIKIDVEGAEASVIGGAHCVLSTMRPMILLEINDNALRAQSTSAEALLSTLRGDFNYDILVFSGATGEIEQLEGALPYRPTWWRCRASAPRESCGRSDLTADALGGAAAQLRRWAIDRGLPLWAAAGFDRERGRFVERLTMQGAPLLDVPARLLVQARQVYSYALAARRGWHIEARQLMERAFASMVRDYREPDGRAGWVFSIHRDGTVADARRDLYAHAFILLAAGSYFQATGDRSALAVPMGHWLTSTPICARHVAVATSKRAQQPAHRGGKTPICISSRAC